MDALFKAWETSRNIYSDYFDKYTLEQLNRIPAGFRNNLVWNIGHIIVAQQSLIYRLSDLPMYVSDDLFSRYKPGTVPAETTSQDEANQLRSLLLSLVESTRADFAAGKFVSYKPYQTLTGFHLASLSDAFHFNNYHEGLHLGMMMSIRKLI